MKKKIKRQKTNLKFVVFEDNKPIVKKKGRRWEDIEEELELLRLKYR